MYQAFTTYRSRDAIKILWRNWAVLFAAFFSLWFVGVKNIAPWRYEWLWFGDLRAAQVHWEFFRWTELFKFPIAGTPNYVREEPHSLLFYLPFKSLNPILPDKFQFLGFIVVTLFIFQAVAAVKLLKLFGLSELHRNLGAVLLVLSPILIFRTGYLSHVMLGGHGFILAAINLYWSESKRVRSWTLVCVLLSLLDPYLMVLAISILVCHIGRMVLISPKNYSEPLIMGAVVALSVLASLFLQGYFVDAGSLQSSHSFRMNVAAFFNPHFDSQQNFSLILSRFHRLFNQSNFSEEIEGFSYLGLGLIVGVIVCIPVVIAKWKSQHFRKGLPLFSLAVAWVYLSLSSTAVLFRTEFEIPFPAAFDSFRATFRGAPRFTILAYYLVAVGVIVVISQLSRLSKVFRLLLPVLLLVQVVDILPGIQKSHQQISSDKILPLELDSTTWSEIKETYKHLKFYPVYNFNSDLNDRFSDYWISEDRWYPIVMFAARSHITSNFGYLARGSLKMTQDENEQTLLELKNGKLESCTIYVLPGSDVWKTYSSNLAPDQRAFSLDGYHLILSPPTSCSTGGND
jgi:hypothetical protein